MELEAYPEPHSCSFCKKLVVHSVLDEDWYVWATSRASAPAQLGGPFQNLEDSKIRELNRILAQRGVQVLFLLDVTFACEAATGGCLMCEEILQSCHFPTSHHLGTLIVGFLDAEFQDQQILRFKFLDENSIVNTEGGYDIMALSDNLAAAEILTRPISRDPGPEKNMQRARHWLLACSQNHELCRRPRETFMPPRLIEIRYVGGAICTRLVECTPGDSEPYITLSYCWGGNQPITTTRSTLATHLERIDLHRLPPTIRDAIKVTSELGVRYLWVDALCIIQDDPSKALEIANMGKVYASALLTIAASSAANVYEGFLRERPAMVTKAFSVPYELQDNSFGAVVLVTSQLKHNLQTQTRIDMAPEPLDARAWTFQERLLSHRILDYGTTQTRWLCSENEYGMSQNQADGYLPPHLLLEQTLHVDRFRPLSKDPGGNLQLQETRRNWQNLCESYSGRQITYVSDRLPAIAGVAKLYQQIIGGQYYSGLWELFIRDDLLWQLNEFGPLLKRKPLRSRPLNYDGPSWSWAAVDRPIGLTGHSECSEKELSIIHCSSHRIVLEGYLRPAQWIKNHDATNRFYRGITAPFQPGALKYMYVDSALYQPLTMYPDALHVDFENEYVEAIPVFLLKVSDVSGLVLRRTGDQKLSLAEYTRLGIWTIDDRHRIIESNQRHREKETERWNQWISREPKQMIVLI